MNTTTINWGTIIFIIVIFLAIVVVAMYAQIRNLKSENGENLNVSNQLAIVTEKLAHIEQVNQEMKSIQVEIRGLSERITSVEQNQSIVNQGVDKFATDTISGITELRTLTNNLTDSTGALRTELFRAKEDLTQLHSHVKAEQESERQIAESIRRLETVIAGTQTKGSAGENVIEVVFSKLPIEWQERNFRIGGKSVEFALRLPNNLIMPIDSKWPATNLIEQFFSTEDVQEQQRIKKAIEDAVFQKAKEVRKYIDPSITVNFGVAVIPDAVYDLIVGVQSEIFKQNVVVISYSMFIPYLLLVFQMSLKYSQSIDLQKLDAHLETAQESLKSLQEELDGRFSRAITMINNSRDDMRAILGKLGGSLTSLQIGTESINLITSQVNTDS